MSPHGRPLFTLLATVSVLICCWACRPEPTSAPPPSLPDPTTLTDIDPLVKEQLRTRLERATAAPSDVDAWLELAKAYHANGLVAFAETSYRHALELRDDRAESWYLFADVLERADRRDAAVDAAARAAELEPEYAPAHWRPGLWLLEASDLTGAMERFERAARVDPAAEAAWFGQVRVLLASSEPDEAIALLEDKLVQSSNAGYARQLLAAAHRQAGRPDLAAQIAPVRLTPIPHWRDPWLEGLAEHHTGLAGETKRAERLIESQRFREAIELLERLRGTWPRETRLHTQLAIAHEAAGERAVALGYLRDALEITPDDHRLHLSLGRVLAQEAVEGKPVTEEALRHLDTAIDLQPDYVASYEARGSLLAERGRLDAARSDFERALALDPGNVAALHKLGRLHALRRNWEAAAATFERLLAIDPQAAPVWGSLASLRIQLGQLDLAQQALDRAAEHLSNEHPQIRTLQAEIDRQRESTTSRAPESPQGSG